MKSSFLKISVIPRLMAILVHIKLFIWFLYKLKLGVQFHATDIDLLESQDVFLALNLRMQYNFAHLFWKG